MSASRPTISPAIAAIFAAVTLIGQLVASNAARDALFLSHFDATSLPAAMVTAAILSVAFLPLLTRLLSRYGPATVMPWVCLTSALLLMGEWLLSKSTPRAAAVLFFIHVAVFGASLVSGFWSVVSERFDPHTAKQHMSRIAAGATAGGVLGGLAAERFAAAGLGLFSMLPLVAGAQLIGVLGMLKLAGSGRAGALLPARETDSREGSVFGLLARTPYLRQIALLVSLTAFVSTIIAYLLKAQAAVSYSGGGELLRFFAVYYVALGLLAFICQLLLSRYCLTRLGLALTIATLPAALALSGAVVLIVPALWSVALLRGADEAFGNSLYRSGYELLYTPVAPDRKRRVKALIDLGFDRLGKTLGGGVVMLLVWVYADTPVRLLGVLCVMGALGSLMLARRLHQGYVEALGESLRSGAVALDDSGLMDATTRHTMIEATGGLDRSSVLEAMGEPPEAPARATVDVAISDGGSALWGTQTLFAGLLRQELKTGSAPPDRMEALPQALRGDPLLESIAALRSGKVERVREVLAGPENLDRHLVSHAISLLARDDLYREVVRALRKVATAETGQLVDVLVDPGADAVIRRRLPLVLAVSSSRVAVDGLLRTLGARHFELRFRSASALARITASAPELIIPPEVVFEAASREIDRGRRVWDSQSLVDSPGASMEAPLLEGYLRQRTGRALELVFVILSLALEPEPLKHALRALSSEDRNFRGTALEYLDTVLPEGLRKKLWPWVGATRRGVGDQPSQEQALSELMKSSETIAADIESLRRQLRQDAPQSPPPDKAEPGERD